MKFSTVLKNWKKKNNLTQQNCVAILGVPFRSLQEWLAGETTPHPDRQTVIKSKMDAYDATKK